MARGSTDHICLTVSDLEALRRIFELMGYGPVVVLESTQGSYENTAQSVGRIRLRNSDPSVEG